MQFHLITVLFYLFILWWKKVVLASTAELAYWNTVSKKKKKSLNPYEEIASFVFNICPQKTSILNVCPLKSLYGIHLHPSLGLPAQRVIWVCEPTSG